MEKINYINKKIDVRQKELQKGKEKYDNKEFISFIAAVVLAIAACCASLCEIPVALNIALACVCGTVEVVCYKFKCGHKHESDEKRIKQEIRHLNGLVDSNPLKNKNKYDKARRKVLAISNSQVNAEGEYDFANDLTNITYALTAIGAVLTAMSPTIVWLPIVSICGSILAGMNEERKYEHKRVLENRLNNLIHDLDISAIEENYQGLTETYRHDNYVEYTNQKEKEKNKVYIKSRD